ncbi:MAG: hypothetical protein O3C28_14445, partial [Proteobacteria bacterium]|nr:hypothetical protein [Pseudomonadota bacterium]
MNKTKLATNSTTVVALALLLIPSAAMAIDWNFSGFIRQEIAVSITNDKNPNNSSTNAFVDQAIPTTTTGLYNPGINTVVNPLTGIRSAASPFGDPTKL